MLGLKLTLMDGNSHISKMDTQVSIRVYLCQTPGVYARRPGCHIGLVRCEPGSAGPPTLESAIAILPYRILLVEDDDANAQIMRIICDRAGWEVVMARNGVQALEAIARQSVDLVLMDVKMPLMDGLEAARRIRANPVTRHMPIVFVTAMAIGQVRADMETLHPAAILLKPFKTQELLAILARAFQASPSGGGESDVSAAVPIERPSTGYNHAGALERSRRDHESSPQGQPQA